MINGLKPYPAMKDSGVPWLGAVPEHWEVRRLKYLLRERDIRSAEGTEQLLRVSQFTGVTERKRADGGDEPDTRAESLVGYKRVEPNDLVVNIMLAWNGSMGVSSFSGIASPAYCVYRFGASARPWYFHHLLRSPAYKARIKAVSTGVVESRLRLYTDDLYRLEALLPPLPEQAAIVRFLDHADRRIRRYIRAKQKLIKLLEEQKQAIIHRAVTRGLDPNVRLKPTGVEWLGDVPEHWEVRRAKYLLREIDARSVSGSEALLRVSQYTGVTPRSDTDASGMPRALSLVGYKRVASGDLVVNIMIAWNGSLAVSRYAGLVSPAYCVYRFLRRVHPWFFHHLLRSPVYRRRIKMASTGVIESRLRLYSDELGRIELLVPPCEEQVAIAEGIDKETRGIDGAIDRAEREIDLLREYRTRLIADVVTGKLDVREAAARLPDEVEEPEPLDEVEPDGDSDEAGTDDADAVTEEVEA